MCSLQFGLSIRQDRVGEAVGDAYELPNDTAYNETCAQIGNMMWAWRMLLATGEPRYADVMELNMYNSTISSVAMDRTRWSYMNPLAWYGAHHSLKTKKHQPERYQVAEPPDYGHTCCPSNLARMELSVHGLLYAQGDGVLSVDHYGASRVQVDTVAGPLSLTQRTRYPWEGTFEIEIEEAPDSGYGLRMRIPDWAAGARLEINGVREAAALEPSSYRLVARRWAPGDILRLELPMQVRQLRAHPKVESRRNHIAVKRGPVSYCLEFKDLPDGVSVFQVSVPPGTRFRPTWQPELFDGVVTLECTLLLSEAPDWDGPLYSERLANPADRSASAVRTRLIPYYCWANRGAVEMAVWLPLGCGRREET